MPDDEPKSAAVLRLQFARKVAARSLFAEASGIPEQINGATLSLRERQIVALLTEGMSNKEIAARLLIANETVQWHVAEIRSKVHARNRTHLVALALRASPIGGLQTEAAAV